MLKSALAAAMKIEGKSPVKKYKQMAGLFAWNAARALVSVCKALFGRRKSTGYGLC